MSVSKLLACFAWFNTFALAWVMLFDLLPESNRLFTVAIFIAFIGASISLSAQSKR